MIGNGEKIQLAVANKKVIPIVLLLDISGNNAEYTANLNDAMCCLEEKLHSTLDNSEYPVVISVITYGTDAKIVTNALFAEEFHWNPITSGGLSEFGQGLKNIETVINSTYEKSRDKDCSINKLMNPIIAIVTRNYPTDNYEKELDCLKEKDWFLNADKLAFYQGDISADNHGMFADFTGSEETTNLPISELGTVVMQIYKDRVSKYEDSSGDFAMSDLIRVDSPDNKKNFTVTYPAKTNVNVNGVLELRRCQITSCSPKNAQDVVLKLEDKDDWLFVNNVSEMPLVATFTVSSLECRRIPHDSTDTFEILANPSVSSKLSLAVKVDFDTFGYMSITNNSDFDISVRHTIGGQGLYLRQNDYVTIGEGIQILKVIKGGKVANDWDNWDWD